MSKEIDGEMYYDVFSYYTFQKTKKYDQQLKIRFFFFEKNNTDWNKITGNFETKTKELRIISK